MIVVWWFVIVICSLILFSGLYVWFESQIYKDHYIPEFETEKKVREIKLRLADIEWRMNKNDESTSSSDNPIRVVQTTSEALSKGVFTTKRTRTKFTLPVDLQNVRL